MSDNVDYPHELLSALSGLSAALKSNDGNHIIVPAGQTGGSADKTQARYQALVEQIPAITFTLNLETGTPDIYVGPQIESILGFTQKEWMEDPILWFFQCHPDDRSLLHAEFTRGIATGGPFRAQVRVHAKDGHVVWIQGEARLVRDDAGNPLFLQGIAFDITEQKRAEQQMKDAQEMKVLNERLAAVGQMAASIGHDLRNPLAAIRNSWHFIQKKLETTDALADKRMKAMAALIDRELVHAGTIIGELLQYSRDREPYKQPTPLAPLFDEAMSVVSKPSPGMRLINEVPEDFVAPNIDRDQFRQVLVNLLQNAVEAIGPDGKVIARARAIDDGGAVVIEIVDNGKGIAPELKDNIWKPLFTTKAKGTGLGLPIVANVVQRHEGMVFVDSAPGRGTTFRLQIPVGTPSEGPAPMQGGAAGDALSGGAGGGSAGGEVRYTRDVEAVRESTVLKELIAECITVVQKPAESMQLLNLVSLELPPVDVDRSQMRQALVNLMQNAVEAIGPDGVVKTKARVEGDDVVIEISDNGCGVAVNLIDDIWKPLFTTKTKGTGLGLPTVKAVAQRHGGDVVLESAPGRGSTFRFRFPRLKPVATE